jgi:hypothetical protein
MAEQKPVDVSQTYASTEDLARLPRAEQQRRLGGTSGQPSGAEQGRTPRQHQRTLSPEEMPTQQSSGRRASVWPPQQQRTLTPEEKARRLALFQQAASQQGVAPFEQQQAADDPAWTPQHVVQGMRQPDGGPHEGFDRRMQRILSAPHPHAVDRDRDGLPDQGGTSSARRQRDFHTRFTRDVTVAAAHANQVDRDRDGYPDAAAPGPDGFRQDQIGYRQRLRARRAAFNKLAEQGAEGFEGQPQLEVIDRPLPGDRTPGTAYYRGLSPLEQARVAPEGLQHAERRAAQVDPGRPAEGDARREPVQSTLGAGPGGAPLRSDPQGHPPAPTTPNAPAPSGVQATVPPGQPNPVSPAPQGGPAEPPVAHAATPIPESAKVSPSQVSPPAAPTQQAIPGQQHPTAQQSPPQQPQSRFASTTPSPPAENAPRPADDPARGAAAGAKAVPAPAQSKPAPAPAPAQPAPAPAQPAATPAQPATPPAQPKPAPAPAQSKQASAQPKPNQS